MKETNNNMLVFVETRNDVIQSVGLELIGKARELADIKEAKVIAMVLGKNITESQAQDLIYHGADEVVVANHELLATYTNEAYAKVIYEIMQDENAFAAFFGASTIGRDLAPRLSCRIHTGLTADCTSLSIDEENGLLLMKRPAFGGNLFATIKCPNHRPQMATVRPGVMQKAELDESRKGEIRNWNVELTADQCGYEVIEEVHEEKGKMNIEDAHILVSGGRGVGNPENLKKLTDLATAIDATVSGSRAIVDAGWIDQGQQVGQTGKTVRPDVYFALGISGAIQHIAGMEESELIIAVNKNANAPIFGVADLGFVGDLNQVVPELTKAIQTAKNNK